MSAVFELRHLRYFVTLAEELHFRRAAERLNIAQPALSQQIQVLERLLGFQLFVTSTRVVTLTPEGRLFLEEARQVLERATQASLLVTQIAQGNIGSLNLGLSPLTLYTTLPSLLHHFRSQHSSVNLTIHELCTEDQVEALRQGKLGAGILHPPVDDFLETECIFSEPYTLALPAAHPLSNRNALVLEDMRDADFIFFPREHGPRLYDSFMACCHAAGFSPKVVQHATSAHTTLGLVATGLGVGMVPRSFQRLNHPGIVYRSLQELTFELVTALAWHRDYLPPTVSLLRAALHKHP
jgi:DNA-binding transcriptional LysR family regulator